MTILVSLVGRLLAESTAARAVKVSLRMANTAENLILKIILLQLET